MARGKRGGIGKYRLENRARQHQKAKNRKRALIRKIHAVLSRRARSKVGQRAKAARSLNDRQGIGYLNSLRSIGFRQLGSKDEMHLALWYEMAILAAFDAMKNGTAHVVMSWPAAQKCPSGIAGLMAIASIASAGRIRADSREGEDEVRAEADEFRAVLFPYARSTHAEARRVQVDRTALGEAHFEHYVRCAFRESDPGTKDYHHVLSRVRGLPGRAVKGDRRSEFDHPILDELLPYGPPRGERPPKSELLWRSKNRTDIRQLARTGEADDPATATYYMYTIRSDDRLSDQFSAIEKGVHLAIVDLSRAGRLRMGWNWRRRSRYAIRHFQKIHRGTGILVLVDDPWVYRFARFELLGSRKRRKKARVKPAQGDVVFSRERSMLVDSEWSSGEFHGATKISVNGFYGEVGRHLEVLRGLARSLYERGSGSEAETVRRIIATVRRSATLPGSLSAFSRFLEDQTTTAMAANLLLDYRAVRDLRTLSDARSLASQMENETEATAGVRRLMRLLESATPMETLLRDALEEVPRSSSKWLVIFRSEMIADFACSEIARHNPKLKEALQSDTVRFGAGYLFEVISREKEASRDQFKVGIFVGPTSSSILETFANPWLPERIVILADANALLYAAKEAKQLATELDEKIVARRLHTYAQRAHKRVREIGRHVALLDHEVDIGDVEFPMDRVVDLSRGVRGERNVLVIMLENGQRILARSSTQIVAKKDANGANPFFEKAASDICVGDEVCVIGPVLLERAQSLVNVRAAAAGEIREYHLQVAARFDRLPGGTVSEQLRHLVEKMGEPAISPHTARYWISLDKELEKDLDEVVPHAPHDKETFLRFTDALGIGTKLAEDFWRWAVMAQRVYKMRAGNVFHDAFRGILTDPHSVLAENVERTEKIYALRAIAEDHVATVTSVSVVESE